jgi:hypothetical protein
MFLSPGHPARAHRFLPLNPIAWTPVRRLSSFSPEPDGSASRSCRPRRRKKKDDDGHTYKLQNRFGTRSMYIIRVVRAHGPCVYVRWRRTGVRSMRRLSADSSKKGTCSRANIDPHCSWKIILSVDFHVDLISHTNTYSVYAFAWFVTCFFR